MKNSPSEKIDSIMKRQSIITIFLTIIGIILAIIGIIISLRGNLPELLEGIESLLKTYPIFWGAMFSWFSAVVSTFIVLFFAYINREKTDQYEKILEKYKKWLIAISISALFYISINLASEALTGTGVPIFSDPYKIGPLPNVSPQDLFLISLVFMIIIQVFLVAPRYYEHVFTSLIVMSIIILGLFFLFCCYAEPISEPPQNGVSEQIWPFGILAVVGTFLSVLFYLKMPEEVKEKFKDDLWDLFLYFCIIPAFVVASLVLIGHKLVTYPNIFGNVVVGFLFISGFATLVILTMILLKDRRTGFCIWKFIVAASLAAISSFSVLFLFLEPYIYEIDTFRKILTFSIAIILVILQYGFSYEKLLKYRFTEWWRREWKPKAMIISILAILIVGVIKPEPIKLLLIFIVLIFVLSLPGLLGMLKFRKNIYFRKFKLKIPLPKYQGMVLVKAKTDPGKLKEVVKGLDSMEGEGVYQTMVVRGEYDVCLIVEGVDSYDIAKKILKIRKINGVASTTTLTDIREFFDREVR